jgi:hypothetical protein
MRVKTKPVNIETEDDGMTMPAVARGRLASAQIKQEEEYVVIKREEEY